MKEINELDLLEKNKKELQIKYPKILDKINNNEDQINIEIIRAKDNNLAMIIGKEEKKYFINSKYRPLDDAKTWVKSLLPIKRNRIIIVFGFGLGYRIRELLKFLEESNKVLIIEPSIEVLSTVMKYIDISQIINDNRVTLFVGKEEALFKNITRKNINWTTAHNVVTAQIPNYSKVFDKEYKTFDKVFTRTHVLGLNNYLTLNVSRVQWQKNIFLNCKHYLNSMDIDILADMFLEKPAIIVSAGPSLNKNVELLKEIKNKAVIISVDTALKILLKHDIYPDMVVSIDGTKENFQKFKAIEYSNIPLVYFPIVYHQILDKHDGDKFVFTSEQYKMNISNTIEETMSKIGQLTASGSVAISAISLAHKVGANPIVLMGQDLAFTDNLSHAKGTATCKESICEQTSTCIPVEDIYGNTVYTSSALYSYLQDIQAIIDVDSDERLYIDATEGGAKIKGTKIMKLKEVIDIYIKDDIQVEHKISNIINKNKLENLDVCKLKKIKYELLKLKEELEVIVDKCEKAYKRLMEMMLIYKENRQFESYEEIKKIVIDVDEVQAYLKEKEDIVRSISYALEFVLVSAVNEIGEFDIQNVEEFQTRDMKEIFYNINFYKKIKEIIYEILPSIDRGINKLSQLN